MITQPRLSADMLPKADTMTKYPSIPTYHERNAAGMLMDENPVIFSDRVIATEKVDGTNVRITLWPDGGWLIGSRDRWLAASGDLIWNPELGIVEHVRALATSLATAATDPWAVLGLPRNCPVALYLELYGGKIGQAAGKYRGRDTARLGFRLFDIAAFPAWTRQMTWPIERLAAERDAGAVHVFATERDLTRFSAEMVIPLTPRLFSGYGADLPTDLEGTALMLDSWKTTRVGLLDGPPPADSSEGIVLRTPDRSEIAKVRREDYGRTLRRRLAERTVRGSTAAP